MGEHYNLKSPDAYRNREPIIDKNGMKWPSFVAFSRRIERADPEKQDNKENNDSKDNKNNKDSKNSKDNKDSKDSKDNKDGKKR